MNLTEYQEKAFRVLVFKKKARFTDLNIDKLPSDHFNYHLKGLISLNIIVKSPRGKYELTEKGKELAGHLDGVTAQIEEQNKTVVIAVCEQEFKGVKKYLIQKRLRQPMYGYYCLPGGKSRIGETLEEAVLRELYEETGLTGEPELREVKHTIKYSSVSKRIIADDILFCFKIKKYSGKLIKKTPEGENFWMSLEELNKIDKVLTHTLGTIQAVSTPEISYKEEKKEYQVV